MSIEKIVKKTVEEYNKYRSPEATAKVRIVEKNKVVMEFSGSFCWTCGVDDWIIDFQYMLSDNGVDTEFEIMDRDYENERFLVIFKVISKTNRDTGGPAGI